jgi:hypothetical protein
MNFGKGGKTMKYKVTIGLIGMVAMVFLLMAISNGVTMEQSAVEEQKKIAKAYVEMKCDPCDYNIDYGDTNHPTEKGGMDEGSVKLECDPCDYNIDYGDTYQPIEK